MRGFVLDFRLDLCFRLGFALCCHGQARGKALRGDDAEAFFWCERGLVDSMKARNSSCRARGEVLVKFRVRARARVRVRVRVRATVRVRVRVI